MHLPKPGILEMSPMQYFQKVCLKLKMQFLNTKRSDDQTKNARPKISPKISYPASLPLHKMG